MKFTSERDWAYENGREAGVESGESGVESRVCIRLAERYCASSSECCESFWTWPFRLTRYRRVKPRRGGSSVCPDKTTNSSCELIQRFALRYEFQTFKNSFDSGSTAAISNSKFSSFKFTA